MTAMYALSTFSFHNTVTNQDEHVWKGGQRDTTSQAFLQTPASLWSSVPLASTGLGTPQFIKPALAALLTTNSAGW